MIADDGTVGSFKGKPGKCATLEAALDGKPNDITGRRSPTTGSVTAGAVLPAE